MGLCELWLFNSLVLVGPQEIYAKKKGESHQRSSLKQPFQLTAIFVGRAMWQQKDTHTSFVRVWL
jgi:hypothetical protein